MKIRGDEPLFGRYRLYRSYENCRRPGVAILDMQMSKVPIIFGYAYSCKLGVSQKNATFFARKGA
jgi:hypothetical protein